MLSADQLRRFAEDGFFVVEELIDRDTILAPLIAEYEALLDGLRERWTADGRLDPNAPSGSFQERVSSLYAAGLDYFQPLDISLPGGEINADTPQRSIAGRPTRLIARDAVGQQGKGGSLIGQGVAARSVAAGVFGLEAPA